MIVLYDLVMAAVILLVIGVAIWYLSNVTRYLLKTSGTEAKPGFFSLSDKWTEEARRKKEEEDAKKKTSGGAAKGGK